jgi:hypothetical protein
MRRIHFAAGSEGDNSDSGPISVGLPSKALPFSTGGLASARNALVKKSAVFRWAGIRIKSQKGASAVLFLDEGLARSANASDLDDDFTIFGPGVEAASGWHQSLA